MLLLFLIIFAFFVLMIDSFKLALASESDPEAKSAAPRQNSAGSFRKVTVDSTVLEIVNHPAFEGFGHLVLPMESFHRPMDLSIQNALANLLPYHNNLDPNQAVEVINKMIGMVADGQTIFYGIYSDEEKKLTLNWETAGVFFFRGRPFMPTAIICAGGGFTYVGSIHEGFPLALELSRLGFNAIVLKYRVGWEEIACEDLARAIEWAFVNAEEFKLNLNKYSLWGSSAGARIVGRLGSNGTESFREQKFPRPGAIIMAYTGYSDFTIIDPPTLAVVGANDTIADPLVVEKRIKKMRSAGVKAEFHCFPGVGHGFGLGIGTPAQGWINLGIDFWGRQILEPKKT
jgi:hypothetical protein